jgi:maleylacetate reductase
MNVQGHQPSFNYHYVPPDSPEIFGGVNALRHLPDILVAHAVRKVLIVTSGSFVRNPELLDRIGVLLEDSVAGVFSETQPHSPIEQVKRATEVYRACKAQGVISLGGGSSVDTAKGVVWYIDEHKRAPPIVHIAIPSTFSGAEYTTDAGISMSGTKRVHKDIRIIPTAVVLDPEVPGTTPVALRRTSLANALAHCLEGSVSIQASPMTDAFYLQAIYLADAAAAELDSTGGLIAGQAVAALAAIHQVPMGLAHALAHVIGGRYRTPHGPTHGVLGPAVMRLNLPAVAPVQRGIARALGFVPTASAVDDAWAAVQGIRALYTRLGVPLGLRDLGIAHEELENIAKLVAKDISFHTNPIPLDNAAGNKAVRECLEWAWSGEIPKP